MTAVKGYRKARPNAQPEFVFPPYGSTVKRGPTQPLIQIPATLSEITGPRFSTATLAADLTREQGGEAIGERILVSGRVLDENGRPLVNTLVELWQCNAAGRYRHEGDQHDAPLDPHFSGAGQAVTDGEGRYRFLTIRPGAYPWRNHYNAWRPAHLHFSLFGEAFAQRLVTQMYFPGDPLLAFDPIFNCVPDAQARQRMVSALDWETAQSEHALAYRFDIVLRGRQQTPWDQ